MAKNLGRIKEEILGVISILSSLYIGLSLFSFTRWDSSLFTYTKTATKNYGGVIGAYISDLLISFIGFAAYLVPAALVVYGVRRLMSRAKRRVYLLGTLLLIFSVSFLSSLVLRTFHVTTENNPGGIIGSLTAGLLEHYLSMLGAYLFGLSCFFSSLILLLPVAISPSLFARKVGEEQKKKPEKGILQDDILITEPEDDMQPEIIEQLHSIEPDEGSEPEPKQRTRPLQKPIKTKDGYILPTFELLAEYDTSAARPSNEELKTNRELIKAKLANFDVEGEITHVQPGPVITLYKFEPAPGVKINKVVSLADDLSLALKAQSIRISPLAGENTIGIEVPNKKREIVSLRSIIGSDRFQKSPSKLTLALGRDIAGETVIADLTKMPHLLVAGQTGAGKSVSVNSMIMSILFKASPREVKMLMIDPKLIELSMYDDIPHLISPVITNPKQAAEALRKMVFEMERRYRLLAEKGARNIDGYNKVATEDEQMPFIVIFIDELADLMFASSREVEDSITRLAQMARAAGIHLIIGTQRPSVDVITGIIKANLPSRISFKVTTKIDSRTILDTMGAEQLLDKGDMLLMLSGQGIKRVHGALVTEDEIHQVTAFIKPQGSPDYSIYEQIPVESPASSEGDSDERDEMYYKACDFAESVGQVSISSIQRKFKIGYNKAARIMELMGDDGLVGPPKGAGKPRDFLRRPL
ncbi:MAG: DNA translocase FtsK 4TM domain-containing protein [Nitrospirae bacterium]|nr:DNA translocase FtsK 4TM domain-containing protein [Nitrospirota bacterium]